MAVRIISSVVALPLLLLFVILGGVYLKAALLVVSLVGMYEFYMAVSKRINAAHLLGFIMEIVYIFMLEGYKGEYFRIAGIVLIMLMLAILVFLYGRINIFDVAVAMFGFFYVGFLLANICLIRNMEDVGIILIWLPFICAWGSDTGAYFVGSAIGKHKLAPVLSPNKSVEGAVGGIAAAAVLAGIYGYCAFKLGYIHYNITVVCIVFGAIGSIFSQIGDLTASSIKRYTKIKDYGKIMPGHGGVLDRFDSVIFTTPIIYILGIVLNHM